MKTKDIVEALCKKYDTRNPFEIAHQKKIMVIHEPLGSINGYYNRCYRQSFIHINSDLEREQQLFTCAHELGHAVLHPKANAPFLRANTFFSINKLEIEANKFAVNLLVQDSVAERFKAINRSIEGGAGKMRKIFLKMIDFLLFGA